MDTAAVGLTAHLGGRGITSTSSQRPLLGVGTSPLGGGDSLFGEGCSLLGVIDAASSGRALAEALIDCCDRDREDRSRLAARNASDAAAPGPCTAASGSTATDNGVGNGSSSSSVGVGGSAGAAAVATKSSDGSGSRMAVVDEGASPAGPYAVAVSGSAGAGAGAGGVVSDLRVNIGDGPPSGVGRIHIPPVPPGTPFASPVVSPPCNSSHLLSLYLHSFPHFSFYPFRQYR